MQHETGAATPPDPAGGIGVIVPFDFALDRELWRWVPEPVELHLTRTPFVPSPVTAEMARAISDPGPVRSATRDLLQPGTRIVAYACTSGSFVDGVAGEHALLDVMHEAGARHALTTAGALVSALGAVGASRVAIVTPYVDSLTDLLGAFLAAHGITSTSAVGLGLLGQIWRVSYEEVVAAARAADRPDAEAVFISCTNLATYDVIAPLERELGKPVLTANQVTMWAALQAIGVPALGPGQRLIAGDAARGPHLRAVPDPAPRLGPGGSAALHRVRVRLPDEAGALARLAESVASAGGNIVAFSVHGQDSESVVDELVVGGASDRDLLAGAVRAAVGRAAGAVLVTEADPHDLVDGQTRALDLAAQAVQNGDPASALGALLHADSVEVVDDEPDPDPHVLAVPGPADGWLVARRAWAPFTVTEVARAEAFVRALTALTAVAP
ncbi:aspartate/glutamate racemase family protein [Pseudonocardia abyssalis]|uniref:Aspartate/glutamate racemase family protein n=1 Tax=Pseudonocardia abyssalis TaxID=2792008 RepID=A0ABS6UN09_9PSEU|nr:aspartate/glutamate racemase family protein [Pseudonocardia abyssalis]MBW0118158.1 aspartate/glutamate racemase family protein [Pseudonocardia abyssalis]MBW0133614.1 aspartate/glutamate racemase family protein [Pseudonocardia abyssalis]